MGNIITPFHGQALKDEAWRSAGLPPGKCPTPREIDEEAYGVCAPYSLKLTTAELVRVNRELQKSSLSTLGSPFTNPEVVPWTIEFLKMNMPKTMEAAHLRLPFEKTCAVTLFHRALNVVMFADGDTNRDSIEAKLAVTAVKVAAAAHDLKTDGATEATGENNPFKIHVAMRLFATDLLPNLFLMKRKEIKERIAPPAPVAAVSQEFSRTVDKLALSPRKPLIGGELPFGGRQVAAAAASMTEERG